MKIYLVGGSVRDRLLNIPPQDTDYLVIGATEEELLAKGLVKVGQTFPIFLNPENGDEYTLGTSLEDDLIRRDLTINAMAFDEENNLIDPYGGEADLKSKILRHVRPENFFEDPVRVLRAARFKAQLSSFSISPDTEMLMRDVVKSPAYGNILPERIIKEMKRVFSFERPSLFFETLNSVNGMDPWFREVKKPYERVNPARGDDELRFSLLVNGMNTSELDQLSQRLNVQSNWTETARAWILFTELQEPGPEKFLEFFYAIDAFRKPRMITHIAALAGEERSKLLKLYSNIKDISISDIAVGLKGKDIGLEIRRMRLLKLKES